MSTRTAIRSIVRSYNFVVSVLDNTVSISSLRHVGPRGRWVMEDDRRDVCGCSSGNIYSNSATTSHGDQLYLSSDGVFPVHPDWLHPHCHLLAMQSSRGRMGNAGGLCQEAGRGRLSTGAFQDGCIKTNARREKKKKQKRAIYWVSLSVLSLIGKKMHLTGLMERYQASIPSIG